VCRPSKANSRAGRPQRGDAQARRNHAENPQFQVLAAVTSGEAAIEESLRLKPDAVILDILWQPWESSN
jgi:hypothetical protein